MFTNKRLKQLKQVQRRIKDCQRDIKKLELPMPDSLEVQRDMLNWLQILVREIKPDIKFVLDHILSGPDNKTRSYASVLGRYLMNTEYYYTEKQKLEDYLKALRTEESRLKEKLGIA